MKSLTPIYFVFGFVLAFVLGAYLYTAFTQLLLRIKLKKRFNHARAGERSAADLLKEKGYSLEETQKVSKLPMWVNGKQFSYSVRPDGFAFKEGKKYLVEIKTGKIANNPIHSPTRRQLLEYFHGFSVEGILLVDAEASEIHHVHFKEREKEVFINHPKSFIKLKLLIAFLLGVTLSLFIIYVGNL
jgi:hypothetical protein